MTLATLYEGLTRCLFKPGSPMCLFRIAFGLFLLEYCILIAPELVTCFSDTNGILRLSTLDHIFGIPAIDLITLLPPGDGWLYLFFVIFVIACLCMTVGLFTRVNGVVVYLGLVSFLHRNIYVHHSGDHLMCLAAFYMMFAPIDAALSLDRLRLKKKSAIGYSQKISLWAAKAYMFQFALVLWQASLCKFASAAGGTALQCTTQQPRSLYFPFTQCKPVI